MKCTIGMAVVLALAACGQREAVVESAAPVTRAAQKTGTIVEDGVSPAGAGSSTPYISATRQGSAILSWLEPVADTKRHALRFSRSAGGKWSEPRTIVERDDLFVNWADFPSIVEDAKGALYAHWLQKSGSGTYSYDVWISVSTDGGAAWGAPFLLNRDGKQSEHGFATLAALPAGGIGAAWLDGRNMMGGEGHEDHGGGDMTLRYATVDVSGTIANEVELDGRTCECCTTGMAMTSNGPVIVYRDRSAEEIRDISFVRHDGGAWTTPAPLRVDGWKIDGCPVNGPQIDAAGNSAVAAWFTAAGEKQNVYVTFSADGGTTFGAPIVADEGKPAGRVDVVLLDQGSALVTWLEQTAAGAEIRARRVTADGKVDPSVKVADSSTARGNGFTRIAKIGGEVWFSWTEQGATDRKVRLARATF